MPDRPQVVLALVVRPKGVAYDLIELSVEGRVIHTSQVRRSDFATTVEPELVAPGMALRCVVQASEPGAQVAAALYAWSTGRTDNEETPGDERWKQVASKDGAGLLTMSATFDPTK